MSIWDTWAALPGYDRVIKSSAYQLATPAFKQKIHDILFRYGIDPTAEQGQLTDQPVLNNEWSVANMLRKQNVENQHGTYNAANQAGLEESGAAAAGILANNEALKGGLGQARGQMAQEVGDALTGYTSDISGIFDRLEKEPVPVPNTNPDNLTITGSGTAADPTIVSAPYGTALPTTPTGTNPWHIPTATGLPQTVATSLKKKVIVGPQNVGLPGYR